MRGDIEGDGGVGEVFFENGIERAGGETFAKFGKEKGALVDFGGAAVFLHRGHGEGADGDEAFFGAFSEDADGFVDGVDVFDVEGGEFGEAEAGGVEEFEDGGVAFSHPGGGLSGELGLHGEFEEFFDLTEGEDDGERFVGFGEFDFGDGAFGVASAVD